MMAPTGPERPAEPAGVPSPAPLIVEPTATRPADAHHAVRSPQAGQARMRDGTGTGVRAGAETAAGPSGAEPNDPRNKVRLRPTLKERSIRPPIPQVPRMSRHDRNRPWSSRTLPECCVRRVQMSN